MNMEEMQRLQSPFTKKGWTHELAQREGPVALTRRHKNGRCLNFEVVTLIERPASTFTRAGNEIRVPCREVYPSSEQWGTYGFTFQAKDESRARMKFRALVDRYRSKPIDRALQAELALAT
jgi:hypothetical protein